MPIHGLLARCLGRVGAVGLLAAFLAGPPLSPAGAAAAPGGPPPGDARIWLYRHYEPYVSLATPYVRFNGRIVGISEPEGAFYRDIAPGEYRVTVDSDGHDVNQFATVDAVAGQQIYIEVEATLYWDCNGAGGDHGSCYPIFYTRLQVPQVAERTIAHSSVYDGS